jgi:hypothetical protein
MEMAGGVPRLFSGVVFLLLQKLLLNKKENHHA